MDNNIKVQKAIAYFTSTKEFYEEAKRLGECAVPLLEKKSQLQNLHTIANSTLRITDILNYIKNQSSKHSKWNNNGFASKLIKYLYEDEEHGLRSFAKKIMESDNLQDISLNHYDEQSIHLQICREFIKQLLVHYLFEKGKKKEKAE